MGRKRVGHDWRTEKQQRQVSFGIISLWILSHSQSETVLLNWKMWLNYHTYTHSIYVTRPKSQHNPLKIQKAFLKVLSLCMLLLLLLSCFNHVWLCATPETAAHQAPPSLGFSRQEHWSGLPFPSPMNESEKWKWSRSVMSDSSDPLDCSLPGSSVHGILQARVLEWGAIAFSNFSRKLVFKKLMRYVVFFFIRSLWNCVCL